MKKLPKQEYTAEFKELAVKRVKAGQSNGSVAKELGLGDQTLRNWVKAFDTGKLNPPGAKAVTMRSPSHGRRDVGRGREFPSTGRSAQPTDGSFIDPATRMT